MMNNSWLLLKSGLGLALCFLMVSLSANPQSMRLSMNINHLNKLKKVTGTVTDAKGEPPFWCEIVVKGTTNGTITKP